MASFVRWFLGTWLLAGFVRWFVRAWFLAMLVFLPACASSCSCESAPDVPKPRPLLACKPSGKAVTIAPPLNNRVIVPGSMPQSFGVDAVGNAVASLSLPAAPSRGPQPDLTLHYSSANDHDAGMGVGFSLRAGSAVTRCPKELALDGEIRAVKYDDEDHASLCLDGKRLVVTAQNGNTMEYRLFPDEQIKVIGHFDSASASHFEAFFPDGSRVRYGATAATRPMAQTGVPRAWLAEDQSDPRGNSLSYEWCFAEDSDGGYTAEYALTAIRYGGFERNAYQNAVALVYDVKDDARTTYTRGMALQHSLQLREIQSFGPDEQLAYRYEFSYEKSETTTRERLGSVQACAGTGECKLPTRFHYAKPETGFEEIPTAIAAPLSRLSSPMVADFTGDGLNDWLVPDTTAWSTPGNPITQWRLARNTGGALGPETPAYLEEWPVVDNAEGPSDPWQLQPELGTVIDYDQNGLPDVLLHDVTGTRVNHIVLRTKMDGTFEEINTQIAQPFPFGPAPDGLRGSAASVHLADVTGDGVPDLIQCNDQGDTIDTALLPTWKVHAWRPGGFDPTAEYIEPLWGHYCGAEMHTFDSNNDGIVDLISPGYIRQGGVPAGLTGTFSAFRRHSDGTWQEFDTGVPISGSGWRTLFVDVNGDGLPDAITSGHPDHRLRTFKNMGRGFDTYPEESLEWDGTPLPQDNYFHLAATGDFDRDGREDIFLPMIDAISDYIPRWILLRATGGKNGYTFESIDSGIPFQAQISDIVEPADPRMPRVADFTGDGAVDVALFLGETLRIFKNRVIDPDVVVGISDGMNDHDPDEPGFIPNVSMTYAHLTDESKTNGQPASASSFYISKDDPANGCAYPRHCVVGPTRVVREYALNDGQGGTRRYGLRYRDGRYDRDTADFLGFGKRILTDLDTGETTIDFYDNITKVKIGERDVYPFVGHIQRQWQWVPGLATQPKPDQIEMMFGDRTLEVVPTNNSKSYFTQPTKLHTRRMQGSHAGSDLIEAYVGLVETLENATMLRDATVDVVDFDEYGNVLEVKTTTDGIDATTHITRTVKNDVNKWMLGLPDTQTECSTGSGMQQCRTIVRTTNEFGEVQTESTSSNDGINDTKLTVKYDQRDKYGNVTHVAADDAFGNHREATTIYDDNGVFPTRQIDALGHVTIEKYDPVLGVLVSETDPNGFTTEWGIDGFAQVELEKRPDGSQTTITRTREKMEGVWRLKERTTTTGGGDDETIADSLGRTIRTYTHGPQPTANAARIMQVIEYDRLNGAVARKSVPAPEGTPSNALKFDVYAYDALAREVKHTTPWNAIFTTAHNGAIIDVTDPSGKHTITQMDASSRLVTVTDAEKGVTKYSYAPFDALYTVTDPGGAVTKWKRDAFGRTRQLDEPDRGTTTFVNSGFGDQLSSTDALGRVVTWTPDALGRPKTRTDKLGAQMLTTSWTWDTATNGIGRLHHLTSPDAVKTYSYTKRGQTEGMTLSVGGESFAAKLQYDNVGRPDVLHYPQPLGELPFGVKYDYDSHGFRIGVRDAATSDAYWELTEVDETGRYKREQFGNGVSTVRSYDNAKSALKSITTTKGASTIQALSYDWDEQLNLKSRTDALQAQNKTERFRYDSLDRLTCTYFSPNENPVAPCVTSYGYAANGNLTSKSDVGILSYTDAKHPHAVTNAPGESYSYNAVGNQVTRPGGAVIAYTPFDLPKTITQGGNTVSFGYDGDEQRIRKASPTSETLYFDELFEQVTTAGTKEYRYHVHSPERAVAIVTRGGSDPGTKYLHVDHLGSVESVTKDDGTVDEKRSYDAFGAKRNPKWGEAGGVIAAKTTKGFTGHEEDDEFGLVNMRGRLFDPRMARFTTPDPVIPDIFDGQSLNAFSYVWNNPLAFVDPSGFDPEEPPILPIDERVTVDETGAITVDLLYPPRDGQPQKTLPPLDASAAVGAVLASADMATTGVAGAAKAAKEGVSSFFEGLLLGSLSDNTSWSATAGSVIGGFIPGVGIATDVRDFGVAIAHVANGDDGAWLELGASIVGFIPGGDIAKAAVKGATKAVKGAAKAGAKAADNVGKVVKGSTAAAADGLSGAQKGAGKVNAPRGPPDARSTLQPGPYATESIPARGHGRNFNANEKKGVNRIGKNSGCHTCGTTNPTTQSGNFVPDHQPPNALAAPDTPQRLYPQCVNCSRKQGGEVNAARVRKMQGK